MPDIQDADDAHCDRNSQRQEEDSGQSSHAPTSSPNAVTSLRVIGPQPLSQSSPRMLTTGQIPITELVRKISLALARSSTEIADSSTAMPSPLAAWITQSRITPATPVAPLASQ